MGRGGWVGAVCTFWYECPSVVLACESLHVCTVCIWRCEHTKFCAEVFQLCAIYKFSFIHSFSCMLGEKGEKRERGSPKLQTLVYDILPSTTAVFNDAIGSRKLSANEQFFCWCSNSSKFVTNNSNKTMRVIYSRQQSLH